MGGRRETASTSLNSGRRGDDATPQGVTESSMLKYTNSLREDLISRNLYTPNRIYPITEKTNNQNVINAVGDIINLLTPFKSYNLKNTWYGRLITYSTPLTEIGLAMLGNQFALNAGSHIAQENYPTFKLANWFDGNKETKVFTKNVNLSITKKRAITNFQQFLDSMVFYNPGRDYPFKPTSTNANFVENSGPGQLSFLFRAFNQNIYKEGFSNTPNDTILTQYSVLAGKTLTKRVTVVNSDLSNYRNYFNFLQGPYSLLKRGKSYSRLGYEQANLDTMESMNNPVINSTQEYAPTIEFVRSYFGTTNKNSEGSEIGENANAWVGESSEFNDDLKNKIVWGRDGRFVNWNADSQGTFGGAKEEMSSTIGNDIKSFGVYTGLLDYTKNLLTASEGQLVDITRKAFKNGQKVVGFNGSALWVANDSVYASYPGNDIAGKTGVRQHSVLDQYNRFAKAIRFNGNTVYNGNENSVIFSSVQPRIHPTMPVDPNGVPNNKNLMFSLENLAVRVISKDGVGIIDDEYGSSIPISEVGQFNGRLMWFPPYDITINETTAAKYDEISMVGRGEPMYSYMNSTRTANLTFTLLVDYPQNLKNLKYLGTDKHRIISEFFAFGGETYKPETILVNPELTTLKKQKEIDDIVGPTNTAEPDELKPADTTVYFPNDFPKIGQESSIIDTMYKTYQYEIQPNSKTAISGLISENGLNESIYFVTGMTGTSEEKTLGLNPILLPTNFSQYTQTVGESELDVRLKEVFQNITNRHYYDIYIEGGASQLYESKYNEDLGLRRANAAKHLVVERIKVLFGDTPENKGIKIMPVTTTGERLAPSSTSTPKSINDLKSMLSRYGKISIIRNGNTPIKKEQTPSLNDQKNVKLLEQDIAGVTKSIVKQTSNNVSQNVMNERKQDQAIQKGFQSIEGNYFNPVFHTQTPEDFHRRLTFLQQCMRQGAAKRYDASDENGILRAKNSVFGRQPICILRIGDFFFTKVIITSLNIDYSDSTWDMNPEGFGMQPMMAKVTLQMNVLGGQSLKGPVDALQNAVSFNHYANSNFTKEGMYSRPSQEADKQQAFINGILTTESGQLTADFNKKATISDFFRIMYGVDNGFNSENR